MIFLWAWQPRDSTWQVLYMPFLSKWPFIPKELFAQKIKELQYVWCYLEYKLHSSFFVKYLSRIRAGYVCKRGMLIKNRISFQKPNVNYSVADELVYGLVVWFFSSLFACLIRTSIIIMFAELCWRTGMQSLDLLLCSFFKRLALHCNC